MHRRSRTLATWLALASVTACWDEPEYPGLWTFDIDVGDREEISAFEVTPVGDGAVWRVTGTFDDRLSRFGRVDADGNAAWTRDLPDDEVLDALAVTGDDVVGFVFQRGEGTYSLRGYDADGVETWSRPWDGEAFGDPDDFVGATSGLYIDAGDGVIRCAPDGGDCQTLYTLDTDLVVARLIPFAGGRLLVHCWGLDRSEVAVLDATGAVLIEREFTDFTWDVAAGGDQVYVHHGDDRLTRIDLVGSGGGTFDAPDAMAGLGAAADGDLMVLAIGLYEDELSRYSPEFELRWTAPVREWGDAVAERADGTFLVWTDELEFPDLWIAAVAP